MTIWPTPSEFDTVEVDRSGDICTITLNRPDVLNAFNQRMLDEFSIIWRLARQDDDVRVVVLQANGDRAFSTGLDRRDGIDSHDNPWSRVSPAYQLGPKSNHLFKPVVTAVNGMCAGGAFYWLAESDIVICSDDAEFFDPHTSYGMTSPIIALSLENRVPYGERIRMALMGLDERVGASRAERIGLVTEVVAAASLRARARDLAAKIARKPPSVVQATVKAAWCGTTGGLSGGVETSVHYSAIGNPLVDPDGVVQMGGSGRPQPERR